MYKESPIKDSSKLKRLSLEQEFLKQQLGEATALDFDSEERAPIYEKFVLSSCHSMFDDDEDCGGDVKGRFKTPTSISEAEHDIPINDRNDGDDPFRVNQHQLENNTSDDQSLHEMKADGTKLEKSISHIVEELEDNIEGSDMADDQSMIYDEKLRAAQEYLHIIEKKHTNSAGHSNPLSFEVSTDGLAVQVRNRHQQLVDTEMLPTTFGMENLNI